MNKLISFLILISISSFLHAQSDTTEIKKYRKMDFNDFTKLSINDTSSAIIDIFYYRKENSAIGQMSFLPITAAIAVFPPTAAIGIGTSIIALPLFINGSYLLIKYRKKKLYNVLTEYQQTKTLPKWIKKKAIKQLEYYEMLKNEEHN